jgi:hypothetical protein
METRGGGQLVEVLNLTLSALGNSYAVTFANRVQGVLIRNRALNRMRFRASSGLGGNYYTIEPTQELMLPLEGSVVGYLEPTNAGDVAECIGLYGRDT